MILGRTLLPRKQKKTEPLRAAKDISRVTRQLLSPPICRTIPQDRPEGKTLQRVIENPTEVVQFARIPSGADGPAGMVLAVSRWGQARARRDSK